MKVLVTCLSKSWGGLEMYTLQTAKQLIKRGIEIDLLCYPNSQLNNEATSQNITVLTAKFSGYFHPIESAKISNRIKQRKYDLIFSNTSKDLWLIVPSLKLAGSKIPLIFTKHMGSYIIKKDFLHNWIYRRVDYALAISNVIAKNLVDTTPLNQDKIQLLHNGIDTNVFDSSKVSNTKVRKEFNIADNELLIGMMARFSPGKGHEEFLQAANKLTKEYGNLKFMIVGEPSKNEDKYGLEIKSLASSLGLDENVLFTGFRKDTPEILAAMDIFVFPSHAEAFGIALVEAMSMGKPTICSNSDGVLDIAVDGLTAYMFKKQNWNDLSDKIELLIKSPEKRSEFGISGRKRAVEMFELEVVTNNLITIFNKALN